MFCVGLGGASAAPNKTATPNTQVSAKTGPVKLTDYAQGLGCACKMPSDTLSEVLQSVKRTFVDDRLLIGNETKDDCSVVVLNDDTAIVSTTDFFPPIVDDPYDFGRIAAANALSDIYAMGAKPITALSVCTFCPDKLELDILSKILQGATDVASEAGIVIGGGHTLRDVEPKFGLAVTGTVHPKAIIRNVGAHEGDVLILTKPLGTGILTRAAKRDLVAEISTAIKWMTTLNGTAASVAVQINAEASTPAVHAMTDVTGFGLAGHLSEMLGGELAAELVSLPFIDEAEQALADHGKGVVSGGAYTNSRAVGDVVRVPAATRGLSVDGVFAVDPQTSGGLLIAVDPAVADRLVSGLKAVDTPAFVLGSVVAGNGEIFIGPGPHKVFTLTPPSAPTPAPVQTITAGRGILLSSDVIGTYLDPKDRGLGHKLVCGALHNLALKPTLPEKIMLVGSGALMAVSGTEGYEAAYAALEKFSAAGVDVMVCVTCVDWYDVKSTVGRVVTSIDVTDVMADPAMTILTLS